MLLTMNEVRMTLRISLQTAYRLVWSGAIPSVKVGRQRRVRRVDLESYLAGRSQAVA